MVDSRRDIEEAIAALPVEMQQRMAASSRYLEEKDEEEPEAGQSVFIWQKALRPRCGARGRNGQACRRRVVEGRNRCPQHGGLSTGPRTEAGKEAIRESNRRRFMSKERG